MNTGKLLVAGLIAAGLAAAMTAWWHQHSQTQAALAFWGGETAGLINRSDRVEVQAIDGVAVVSRDRLFQPGSTAKDITTARGLVHFRHSLLVDASFDWNAELKTVPAWEYAVRFSDAERDAIVLFDLKNKLAAPLDDAPMVASMAPIAEGVRTYLDEQFADKADQR